MHCDKWCRLWWHNKDDADGTVQRGHQGDSLLHCAASTAQPAIVNFCLKVAGFSNPSQFQTSVHQDVNVMIVDDWDQDNQKSWVKVNIYNPTFLQAGIKPDIVNSLTETPLHKVGVTMIWWIMMFIKKAKSCITSKDQGKYHVVLLWWWQGRDNFRWAGSLHEAEVLMWPKVSSTMEQTSMQGFLSVVIKRNHDSRLMNCLLLAVILLDNGAMKSPWQWSKPQC